MTALAMMIGNAPAASTSTVVGVTVPSATTLNQGTCVSGAANITDFGPLVVGQARVLNDCLVTWGSSNDSSMLRLYQSDGYGQAMYRHTNGALDTTFGCAVPPCSGSIRFPDPSTIGAVQSARQPDGKMVYLSFRAMGANDSDFLLMRRMPDGTTDTTFGCAVPPCTGESLVNNSGGEDQGFGLLLLPDGKFLAVGRSMQPWPNEYFTLVRYNQNGTPDTTFGINGLSVHLTIAGEAHDVAVQPDGKYVVVGRSTNGTSAVVARFLQDGSIDTSFGCAVPPCSGFLAVGLSAGFDIAQEVALQADGKIVVVGWSTPAAGNEEAILMRLQTNGTLDLGFGGTGVVTEPWGAQNDHYNTVNVMTDGGIVVAGYTTIAGVRNLNLARYNPATGSLDANFDGYTSMPGYPGNGKVTVSAVLDANASVVQLDGKLVVAGSASNGVNQDMGFARIDPVSGALDTQFGTGGVLKVDHLNNDRVRSLALDRDGSIVAGGYANGNNTPVSEMAFTRLAGLTHPDYAAGTDDWSAANSAFGICMRAVSAGVTAAAGYPVDGDADCADGNTDPWRPVAPTIAPAKLASSTGSGVDSLTATLAFGMKAGPSQPVGAYFAPLLFEVVAPNA